MRNISGRTGLATVALCAMAGLMATPVDAAGSITTSLFLPLAGTVLTTSDPCTPSGDSVTLSGNVHVVSIVPPGTVRNSVQRLGMIGAKESDNAATQGTAYPGCHP